jgi:hypothetical protein
MARQQLRVNTMAHIRAPRRDYYSVEPAAGQSVRHYTAQQLAARRTEQRELYARWQARQARYAEHDRKVRRIGLAVAAIVIVAVLGGLVWLGWQIGNAAAAIGLDRIAGAALLLIVVGLLIGGRRCITVVEHWHR